jgi:hypothetical protein
VLVLLISGRLELGKVYDIAYDMSTDYLDAIFFRNARGIEQSSAVNEAVLIPLRWNTGSRS